MMTVYAPRADGQVPPLREERRGVHVARTERLLPTSGALVDMISRMRLCAYPNPPCAAGWGHDLVPSWAAAHDIQCWGDAAGGRRSAAAAGAATTRVPACDGARASAFRTAQARRRRRGECVAVAARVTCRRGGGDSEYEARAPHCLPDAWGRQRVSVGPCGTTMCVYLCVYERACVDMCVCVCVWRCFCLERLAVTVRLANATVYMRAPLWVLVVAGDQTCSHSLLPPQ